MAGPIMRKAQGDGVNINLAVWEGEGKNILCIHGITANCRSWDMVAESLAPEHTVMAMDLKGRGLSDKPDGNYSLDQHVKDILCIMDDLGIDQIVPMGHSLGAFITLVLSVDHPDRIDRSILVDGGGDLSPEQLNEVFIGIKPALDRLEQVYPSAEAYLEKMKSAPYMQPWNSVIENYYQYEIEETEGGVRTNIKPEHIAEEAGNVRLVKCTPYCTRLKKKVLILRATEGLLSQKDILLPEDVIDNMMKEIPDATRVDIEGTNHYGIVFQPSLKRDQAIRDFLIA